MTLPSTDRLANKALDITFEKGDSLVLEIQRRDTGLVFYAHVNGITVMRVCRVKKIQLNSALPDMVGSSKGAQNDEG